MLLVAFSSNDEWAREEFQSACDPLFRTCGWRLWCAERLPARPVPLRDIAADGITAVVLLIGAELLRCSRVWPALRSLLDRSSGQGYRPPVLGVFLDDCPMGTGLPAGLVPQHACRLPRASGGTEDGAMAAMLLAAGRSLQGLILEAERPAINQELHRTSLPRVNDSLPVLARPAARRVEVLVGAGNGLWYPQTPIMAGSATTRIILGSAEPGQTGLAFSVVAITSDHPLTEGQELTVLPPSRTRSDPLTVFKL